MCLPLWASDTDISAVLLQSGRILSPQILDLNCVGIQDCGIGLA